jgi:hypothetical protein
MSDAISNTTDQGMCGRVQRVQKQEKEEVSQGGTKTNEKREQVQRVATKGAATTFYFTTQHTNGVANQSMSSA